MHPDYDNVAIGIWQKRDTKKFFFICDDGLFGQPYDTLNEAEAAYEHYEAQPE
jgi:hypothetical protein